MGGKHAALVRMPSIRHASSGDDSVQSSLRNIAIVAHVDHGKTTLVDELLRQSGEMTDGSRVMDSGDLEKERGITITSKITSLKHGDVKINVVDTPGHADFGGEVERILSTVDSVLLLVDASEGPMPQTRFVTAKAFERGLKPIVVVNKVDRPTAKPDVAVDKVFTLFESLGATDEQLDFPMVFTSAIRGTASLDYTQQGKDFGPLFETILQHSPPPKLNDGPFQMQITALDYDQYMGGIGVGRITRGNLKIGDPITVLNREGEVTSQDATVTKIMAYQGLRRVEMDTASCGDIVAIAGIENPKISDTFCAVGSHEAMPPLDVDEPTLSVVMQPNSSPLAGREGDYSTMTQIQNRLEKELRTNVSLRVEPANGGFTVSGRGEMHLGTLIETMRRESFEMSLSRPQVVMREVDGEMCEPFETLALDVEQENQGFVQQQMGQRSAEMTHTEQDEFGRVRFEYIISSRKLIGFRALFVQTTQGTGIMHHTFDHYAPVQKGKQLKRTNGVLVSNSGGKAVAFALFAIQNRGKLFIKPGDECYEGMLVGLNSRSEDLVVNPVRGKQLTNMRSSGSDESIILAQPEDFTLEKAMQFIEDDELVEVTPKNIRLRKKILQEGLRKRPNRSVKKKQ